MKNFLLPASTVLVLALGMIGCQSDGGLSARKQEKSAAYATARTWQKNFIEKGVVANGFTKDLVYVAMGTPTRIETKELPEGPAEMWTYAQYYPHVDAIHGFRTANFSAESAYQPQRALNQTNITEMAYANDYQAAQVPMGMDRNGGESIGKTGGAQGGSMEPAGLRSYTIKVLFAGDKVVRIGADENPH